MGSFIRFIEEVLGDGCSEAEMERRREVATARIAALATKKPVPSRHVELLRHEAALRLEDDAEFGRTR